LENLLGKQI